MPQESLIGPFLLSLSSITLSDLKYFISLDWLKPLKVILFLRKKEIKLRIFAVGLRKKNVS